MTMFSAMRAPQLAVELRPVLTAARDDPRGAVLARMRRQAPRHLGVARNHAQHRAAVVGRMVLAARLVVARDVRPSGHRGEQQQARRRGRLDRLCDGTRPERPDEGDRVAVTRRLGRRTHVIVLAVRDVLDPGTTQDRICWLRKRLGQRRVDGGAQGLTGSVPRFSATYLVSRYSSMPSGPPSRPKPDCLTPPNGAPALETIP